VTPNPSTCLWQCRLQAVCRCCLYHGHRRVNSSHYERIAGFVRQWCVCNLTEGILVGHSCCAERHDACGSGVGATSVFELSGCLRSFPHASRVLPSLRWSARGAVLQGPGPWHRPFVRRVGGAGESRQRLMGVERRVSLMHPQSRIGAMGGARRVGKLRVRPGGGWSMTARIGGARAGGQQESELSCGT
jgi:hypothetical protein